MKRTDLFNQILLWLSLASFSIFCTSVASAASSDMKLAIVGDSMAKPKNWLDESGQPRGIMIDLLQQVSSQTGIVFSYELVPWKRAFLISEQGQAAIIGFSKTTERQKLWHYSESMYEDPLVIVTTRNTRFDFNGLNSLAGKRLSIKLGTSYGDDFEQAKARKLFEVVEISDRAGQLRMLTLGRVDAVLVSPGQIALDTLVAEDSWFKQHRADFVVLDPPYKLDPNYLGLPKSMGKEALLPLVNKALADMRADGRYQEIVDRNIKFVLDELARRIQ